MAERPDAADREQRLAEALRANLRRRKAQTGERPTDPPPRPQAPVENPK